MMETLCQELLEEWCQALLKLQIRGMGNPRLDGAILCPGCGIIHGRCFEAMYPFLYMAEVSGDDVWVTAAEQLFTWAQEVVSQPDGSYLNDIGSDWKGTTVFNVIQLSDCFLHHERVIPDELKQRWRKRLKQAAEFLYTFDEINDNNINYPLSNALALYECGLVLNDSRYMEKARRLAALAERVMTEHHLLFGEGIPHTRKSSRGCRPVDVGYNIEETLPSLALYGMLSGDTGAFKIAEKGLLAQLIFMVEDGAWDNSFGTRNFKWTYWGSRTSDGCALGYLLMAGQHPEFALAAEKNLNLLRECTEDGLLAGGPHYRMAGQPVCIHHTFTHAKVLAGILDRNLCRDVLPGTSLPRRQLEGIRHYPEIDSWLITHSSMTATVTAYDWEYMPGGHVSGGTLSFLHHNLAGPLLCAGMGEYTRREPCNMQVPEKVRHECLALRIERWSDGMLYSSIYEDCARVTAEDRKVRVCGCLKNIRHEAPADLQFPYVLSYEWKEQELLITGEFAEGVLLIPLISRSDEPVEIREDNMAVTIQKGQRSVCLETSKDISLPYGTERIFHLVPGLQALRVDVEGQREPVRISLSVQS